MLLLPKSYWHVQQTEKKGRGIFATKDIPAGKVVGDYIGKVIHEKDEDKYDKMGDPFYLMYYNHEALVHPDPKTPGIHIINHSCTPNLWMYTYKGHTLYFSLRRIFAGEELTVSYLLSPQDKDCNPCEDICHCDAVLCFRTMHLSEKEYNEWEKFDDAIEKETKPEPVEFGKTLPILDAYPEVIPDNSIYTLFGSKNNYSLRVNDKKLPTVHGLRRIIRQSGRTVAFPKMNLRVHGVMHDLLISETLS